MKRKFKITGGRYIGSSGKDSSHQQLKKMIDSELSRESQYLHQVVDLSQQSRAQGIINEVLLKQSRVFIWGAGGVGSRLALHLAGYCGEITCVDFDKVDAPNVRAERTPYSESDIGTLKVKALGKMMLRKYPRITYTPIYRDYGDFTDDEIVQYASMSDIMVYAIDEIEALIRGDELTHGSTINLFPAGHEGVRTGHIAISRPGGTCFRHILGIESEGEMQQLHREPGLGLDFDMIALWAAKTALALLSLDSDEISQVFDRNHNFIFINNRISSEEQTRSIHRGKHKTCVICNG